MKTHNTPLHSAAGFSGGLAVNPEFWAGVFCGGLGLSCLVVLGLAIDYAEKMSCENGHD